jgi:glutamate--cysteine ligase
MSTYLGTKRPSQIITLQDLKRYFRSFAKPASEHAIGVEWELFGVCPETGKALPYSGNAGIEAVLNFLRETFGYDAIWESGHTVALSRGENHVALEPGAQLELSAEPVRSVTDVAAQLESFRDELLEVSRNFPVRWIAVGFHPFSAREDIEWVPKKRYEIMKAYLGARGSLSHDMMKRTCANQVNFDYENETDAVAKLIVIYRLTTLVSALFANSPLGDGKLNGYLSYRMAVWRNTDPSRSGFIASLLNDSPDLDDYLDYVLDTPMMFIVRQNEWIAVHQTFREFLLRGYRNHRATLDDFELHLSTIFPEARLKNCLEIRGADGQPFRLIPAVAALWKGLLYDADARAAAGHLLGAVPWEEHLRYRVCAETEGLRASLAGRRGWEWIREIFQIARRGLIRQQQGSGAGTEEARYLDYLYDDVIKPERTSAENLVKEWDRFLHNSPMDLVDFLKI